MNNIIKYIKKIIRPKNFRKVSLENLGMRNLGNSIYDGCLKKNNIVRYSRFILGKKTNI